MTAREFAAALTAMGITLIAVGTLWAVLIVLKPYAIRLWEFLWTLIAFA